MRKILEFLAFRANPQAWLVKKGATFMFKKWRERVATRAMETAKGKLTYASIAALVLPTVSAALGFDILPADVQPIWDGVMAAFAIWGKYRASRGYK